MRYNSAQRLSLKFRQSHIVELPSTYLYLEEAPVKRRKQQQDRERVRSKTIEREREREREREMIL